VTADVQQVDTVRGWLAAARSIVVLTGAGMSAESGVPTFRDAQTGLWAQYRPEDLATEAAFRARPSMVWDWYAMRRERVSQARPNAGHRALADFQRVDSQRLTVVTQNVDGLHQQAGSTGVLALHGNLHEDRWLEAPRDCCRALPAVPGSPPACPQCGNLRRPAVVWFGEALPVPVLHAAEQACRSCDLMLVVGTSGLVHPAAGLPRLVRTGAHVVVINPEPSALDTAAHVVIRGTAATVLPALLETSS